MRPLIVGNWKMHGLRVDLAEIESIAATASRLKSDVEILVCPPATLVAEAARIASGRIAIVGRIAIRKFRATTPETPARRC
jgi:triosephosphate isomerase